MTGRLELLPGRKDRGVACRVQDPRSTCRKRVISRAWRKGEDLWDIEIV